MRLHGCRIGCMVLLVVALASFCPWVSVVGQSGGSGGNPLVPEDNFLNFFADHFTDHYYEIVTSEHLTWAEAVAAAESRTFLGVQGHLATLTSEHESHWVGLWALFRGNCWVGGYQVEASTEPDGGWQWVTAEPWDYTDWGTDKPDDVTGEQKYLRLFVDPVSADHVDGELSYDLVVSDPMVVLLEPTKWDDSADTLAPYIVEYDELPPLVEVVATVEEFVQDLPDEAFDRNPRLRRRQLANQLTQVKRMLSRRNYDGAARKLAVDILPRVGGGRLVRFSRNRPIPSPKAYWIVEGDAQQQLGNRIAELVWACRLQRPLLAW